MSAQDSAQTVDILEKLKSAILNIDWEISDDNIGILDQEIAALRPVWQGQKVHMIYLQIMGALSQYIASTREQATPAAFPMLRNVFDSLEDMVVNPSDEDQQTEKAMVHVDAYNELKKSVSSGKTEPAPTPEPEPEPEVEVVEAQGQGEKEADEEQPSTINSLLNDKEDHTTDSIFDSMLDEMVQVEPPEQEASAPPPKAPPARPPVQTAYNKDDGTEVEADRNIDGQFAEADELLDDFFVDDVPAPGAAGQKDGDEFDLGALDGGEEAGLELDLADDGDTTETAGGELGEDLTSDALADVEDSDLDIFKVEEESDKVEISEPEPEAAEFPEVESALDDFFAGEEEATPSQVVSASLGDAGAGGDLGEVDAALDDFFDDEEPKAAKPGGEVVPETAKEAVSVVEGGSAVTVAGLKTLLLSVDWEVDDQLLDRVDLEISALSENLTGNDSALIHLNFLQTVIRHVSREQSQVISESMACLNMLTESLEELLADEGGREAWYAAKAVSSFVDWHELVVAEFEKRLDAAKGQGGEVAEGIEGLALSAEGEISETQRLKKEILSEVRDILSKEMQIMRQELSAKG